VFIVQEPSSPETVPIDDYVGLKGIVFSQRQQVRFRCIKPFPTAILAGNLPKIHLNIIFLSFQSFKITLLRVFSTDIPCACSCSPHPNRMSACNTVCGYETTHFNVGTN
jgi:hypothetical protein